MSNKIESDWEDVTNKSTLIFLKNSFLKYFVFSIIIVLCSVFKDGEIEITKVWLIPISVLIITGCLYVADISFGRVLKLFK